MGEQTVNLKALPWQLTIDKAQAAEALGVPIDTVLNLTRTGQLESIMVGKHRRWLLDDLKTYVETLRTQHVGVR